MKIFPESSRITDRYFWLTALIIARNAITREYQNSFLGMVWTVVLPLIQVVIYALIIPMIMARNVVDYPLYLVASFPLWAFISASLVNSCTTIIKQAETIKRSLISPVVFPIADVLKQFFNYAVAFLTMYLFMLFIVPFHAVVLWLPVLLLPLFITILSLSIAIAYVAPYVRDVGYLIHMVVNILFWFTPVVYPLEAAPEHLRWLFWLNPFYILMHPAQQLIYAHALPDAAAMLAQLAVMAASIVISLWLYRRCRRNYVYYL